MAQASWNHELRSGQFNPIQIWLEKVSTSNAACRYSSDLPLFGRLHKICCNKFCIEHKSTRRNCFNDQVIGLDACRHQCPPRRALISSRKPDNKQFLISKENTNCQIWEDKLHDQDKYGYHSRPPRGNRDGKLVWFRPMAVQYPFYDCYLFRRRLWWCPL